MKTLPIKIDGVDYVCKFPNIGQILDIEDMKNIITRGRYAELIASGTKISEYTLDVADSISYFSVLIPELKTNLKIENWRDISAETIGSEILQVYKNDFLPWFKPLMEGVIEGKTNNKSENEGEGLR